MLSMRAELLEQAIEADLAAGRRPFCIVATIGTTSSTSSDPLGAILDIAKRYNLWVHLDSAYAGVTAILPEFQYLFARMNEVDSLVMNPHKWMFVPTDASVFYTRHPEILRRAFTYNPEYLSSSQDPRAVNLMDYGFQLGRRFRAVKLWFAMRYFGLEGMQKILRGHMAMAKDVEAKVLADDRFELTAPVPLSTICFRLKASEAVNRQLLEAINNSGEAFLSQTTLRGEFTLRIAIGNMATEPEDIEVVWKLIQRLASELLRAG